MRLFNFVKEIEFEHFRKNYTYEEAEQIRLEFEKIAPGSIGYRSGTGLARRTRLRPRLAEPLRDAARGVRDEGSSKCRAPATTPRRARRSFALSDVATDGSVS